MCGIAGFLQRGVSESDAAELAESMATAIRHRGPDDSGVWIDAVAGVALAHRRLSVIDVSAAGHQPMVSASGRYVVVYNGEIYNHLEIRAELEKTGLQPVWRGHSDTETLLAACDAWGVGNAIGRCVGMFAIALLDRSLRRLHLVRDRMGEKPLYYAFFGGAFVFGSELPALRRHPRFSAEIAPDALARYLNRGYVAGHESIYAGVYRLPPGSILDVDIDGVAFSSPRRYWSAPVQAASVIETQDTEQAAEELHQLLRRAVRSQMTSDVPLGAFLSGGVDSSLIVALMQEASARPVKTFTIGFGEARFDEASFAREVARHLGTEHHELYVSAQDALAVVDRLPVIYGEPLGDSSQIPTFIVSKLAHQSVTVALSGDAGDELFCGYDRYFLADDLWRRLRGVPMPLRNAALQALGVLPVAAVNTIGRLLHPILPAVFRRHLLGDDLAKGAGFLAANSPMAVYLAVLSQDPSAGRLVRGAAADTWPESATAASAGVFLDQAMHLDQATYLPDDILVKVDRAAMAVSLETRVPFLDYRVVEFANALPLGFKRAGGQGKTILKSILAKHMPRALFDRPKAGFSVPVAAWLRGPLRPWGDDLINSGDAADLIDVRTMRDLWRQHQQGHRDWQYVLWNLFMFLAWYRVQRY